MQGRLSGKLGPAQRGLEVGRGGRLVFLQSAARAVQCCCPGTSPASVMSSAFLAELDAPLVEGIDAVELRLDQGAGLL